METLPLSGDYDLLRCVEPKSWTAPMRTHVFLATASISAWQATIGALQVQFRMGYVDDRFSRLSTHCEPSAPTDGWIDARRVNRYPPG
jgi:hypothetical protein